MLVKQGGKIAIETIPKNFLLWNIKLNLQWCNASVLVNAKIDHI